MMSADRVEARSALPLPWLRLCWRQAPGLLTFRERPSPASAVRYLPPRAIRRPESTTSGGDEQGRAASARQWKQRQGGAGPARSWGPEPARQGAGGPVAGDGVARGSGA